MISSEVTITYPRLKNIYNFLQLATRQWKWSEESIRRIGTKVASDPAQLLVVMAMINWRNIAIGPGVTVFLDSLHHVLIVAP